MPKSALKQNIMVCRPGFSELLRRELRERFSIDCETLSPAAITVKEAVALPAVEETIFARQVLPRASQMESIQSDIAGLAIVDRLKILAKRGNRGECPWTIHAYAMDDDDALKIATKIQGVVKNTVQSKEPGLHKRFVDCDLLAGTDEFDPATLIVQVWAASADVVYLSMATIGNGVLPYVGGALRMKTIPGAPSRSASKLSEALRFMKRLPRKGETGVDLGAAPGGWTYVMAVQGVDMTAVDHAALELPTKKLPGSITHLKENGLTYIPQTSVDWLCCDMVMGAKQSLDVLSGWIEQKKMKHFVVNLKLPHDKPWPAVNDALAFLAQQNELKTWTFLQARQLFHDRSEITLMGSIEPVRKPDSGSKVHSKDGL